MSSEYNHLPGVEVEFLDGNLQIDRPISGPVALVIGTAFSGTSGVQYLVTDSNKAAAIFGSGSPILEGLSDAKAGGATNVILYRVGGASAEIANLFGAGSLVKTREETAAAATKYSVYVGPSPKAPADSALIVFSGSRIVYSNVAGAEVDQGEIEVLGFDKSFAYKVGSPTQPVRFDKVLENVVADASLNEAGDGTTTTYDLAGGTGATVASAKVDGVDASYTVSAGTGVDGADQIVFDAAPANAGAIVVEYTVKPSLAAEVEFSPGEDNVSASNEKLYELLDKAYADLETTQATHVFVTGAVLDAENIADGSTATGALRYLRKEEVDGEVSYEWGSEKVTYQAQAGGETNDPALAEVDSNGQPIVSKVFNEVNFAHQLGEWCHAVAEDERVVLGAIGTSSPQSASTAAISKHLGTLPKRDIHGNIIADGTGLLGNRFMSGSRTQVPGFYKTDTGFPDGNPQSDSNGALIDLGKYISIVASDVVKTSAKGFSNGAGVYLGLLTTVTGGNSTTNASLRNSSTPYIVKKRKLDELSGAGYVTFKPSATGAKVVSGELPTGPNSDYDYVSTTIIVAEIAQEIRDVLDPFLGKGLNQVTVAAADTAVQAVFQRAVQRGAINKYSAQVIVDPVEGGRGKIRVPITIVPAFELREVSTSLKLAYDI